MTGSTERLAFLLDISEREARHLRLTTDRLFAEPIDTAWIARLEGEPDLAERLDAFAARFGRLQDTVGEKLVPELMRQLLENPGSAIDNLNRMEKLGLLSSLADWIEGRNLRDRLVHEYMLDGQEFAQALKRAHQLVPLLVETYLSIQRYAQQRRLA